MPPKIKRNITYFIILAIFLACVYIFFRLLLVLFTDVPTLDKTIALLLVSAEMFGIIHAIGYFLNVRKVYLRSDENIIFRKPPPLKEYPPIAILIPSYKEPIEVLTDTLICVYNLTYPNKHIYFLDDTRYDKPWDTPEKVQEYKKSVDELCQFADANIFRRKWRGAKAGIINDFIEFMNGEPIQELDYQYNVNGPIPEKVKYFLVFDADMCAFPDFIEPIIAHLENNPKIAIIQTPQYYSNFENNRVAMASGLQQVFFFQFICEGKGLDNAMFCCGTNFVARIEAFNSVGGFDESSVTEDFATSMKLHVNGWQIVYYNKVLAFGMGPENLNAFFKQQFRWAVGTIGMWKKLLYNFIVNGRKCAGVVWWEYLLSVTHYFIGVIYLYLFLCPIIFLLFNIPVFFSRPDIYLLTFFPYIIFSMFTFLYTIYERNFTPMHTLFSVLISAVAFPVYVKAAIYGTLGLETSFGVTPKIKGGALPLRALWPQITLLLLCAVAITWGLHRIYYEGIAVGGLIGNIIWCIWNFLILSSVFYFNNPEVEPS